MIERYCSIKQPDRTQSTQKSPKFSKAPAAGLQNRGKGGGALWKRPVFRRCMGPVCLNFGGGHEHAAAGTLQGQEDVGCVLTCTSAESPQERTPVVCRRNFQKGRYHVLTP